jgi:hypothetical protein
LPEDGAVQSQQSGRRSGRITKQELGEAELAFQPNERGVGTAFLIASKKGGNARAGRREFNIFPLESVSRQEL